MNVEKKDNRQMCKYGAGCYQKNPMHHEKFRHPEKQKDEADKENAEVNKRPLPSDSSEDDTVDAVKKQRVGSLQSEDESKYNKDTSSESEDHKDTSSQSEIENDKDTSEAGDEEKEVVNETEEVFDDLLPASPEDMKEKIKQKFLVEMPEDFYEFYEFCKGMNKESPHEALAVAGLKLCGPFDLLGGLIPSSAPRSESLYLRHFRYYYDPPEFQTVITSTNNKLEHLGYFRDSPSEAPVFVASTDPEVGPKITPLADNLFGAVYHFLAKKMESSDPFLRTKISGLQEKVKLHANRTIIYGDSKNISLDHKTAGMKLRDRQKVSTTFHGAGLVVPYDKKNDVGYREIPESTASLKKIFKNVVEAENEEEKMKSLDVLQELITNVQFANDEGDPGMGLELGIDAFAYGGEALHNSILHLLTVGYQLVDREEFATIITAHLKHRMKGPDVDMFAKYRK